jgi:predicted TIM-barrel fold metal-dependent hydrolase
MKKIDFETHFYTKEYLKVLSENKGYPRFVEDGERKHRLWHTDDVGQPYGDFLLNPLLDLGEGRIKNMDSAGIDVQVLSLSAPGIEKLDPGVGKALAKSSNDALAEAIGKYPDRLTGFAALAPSAPEEAADELERAVKDLGFIGWNTHSNFGDSYLDEEKYWPILERAEKLDAPIYLHPTIPPQTPNNPRTPGRGLALPFKENRLGLCETYRPVGQAYD